MSTIIFGIIIIYITKVTSLVHKFSSIMQSTCKRLKAKYFSGNHKTLILGLV